MNFSKSRNEKKNKEENNNLIFQKPPNINKLKKEKGKPYIYIYICESVL